MRSESRLGLLCCLAAFIAAGAGQDSSIGSPTPSIVASSTSSTVASTSIPLLLPTPSSSVLPTDVYVNRTAYGPQLFVHEPKEPALGVAGGILIIVSLATLLLGATTVWTSAGTAGFLLAALFALALICILRLQAIDQITSHEAISMMVATATMAGLIGATAASSSRHLCALVGATGGIAFGYFILSLGDDGLITSIPGRLGLLAGLAVLGTISATEHAWRDIVRIGWSSLTGAAFLMIGIDCFARNGLREMLLYQVGCRDLFPGLQGSLPTSPRIQLQEGIGCIIFLLGVAFQRRVLYHKAGPSHQLASIDVEDLERDVHDLTMGFKDASALEDWEIEHGGKRSTVSNTPSLPHVDSAEHDSIEVNELEVAEPAYDDEGDEEGRTPPPPFEEDEPTLESRFGGEPTSVFDMLGEGAEETAASMGDFYVAPLRRSYAVDPQIAAAEALRAEVAALRAQLEVVDPPPPPEPAPDFLGVALPAHEEQAQRRLSSWSLPSRYMAPVTSIPQADPDLFSAPWLQDDYHAASPPKPPTVPRRPPIAVLPAPSTGGSIVFTGAQAGIAPSELSAWSRPDPRRSFVPVPGHTSQSVMPPQSIMSSYSRAASSVRFAPSVGTPRATSTRRSLAPEELATRHRRKLAELQQAAVVPAGKPAPPDTVSRTGGRARSSSTETATLSTTTTTSSGSEGTITRPKARKVGQRRTRQPSGEEGGVVSPRRKVNGDEARQTRHSHWLDYA